ncbi:MAG: baseplate J/gp47 family protein, partial [Clostridiales bacterium]|nr:baseplate J/gp47 family protein [Clostridiales bacterium]
YMPTPGIVDIRLLINNNELPDETFIDGLFEFLKAEKVRPLTDQVLIAAPEIVEYNIDLIYYIREYDRNNAPAVQQRLADELSSYIAWQGTKIGRDIVPSVLIRNLMEAGIKRVIINSPVFTKLEHYQLARVDSVNVVFGGLEND